MSLQDEQRFKHLHPSAYKEMKEAEEKARHQKEETRKEAKADLHFWLSFVTALAALILSGLSIVLQYLRS